jgi:hypothetical protein
MSRGEKDAVKNLFKRRKKQEEVISTNKNNFS